MKGDCWIYYETDAEGNARHMEFRTERLSDVRIKVALICPAMLTRKFNHYAELARAAPGGPGVDMTHWQGDGKARRLVYSARLRYLILNA